VEATRQLGRYLLRDFVEVSQQLVENEQS
jgi:hypothetical protein